MRLSPGDTFDRYTIEELLGEGGMGEVYRALDTRLDRRVALKILRKTPEADPKSWHQSAVRMLREARAAAALSHPNTIALYDIGEHEGAPFLAMELVEGTPLRRFVGADVPQSSRLRWLLDVARALAAAHRAGIVHRDIKPENVMLRSDGVIKVLDFGIARRVRLAAEGAAPISAATPTVTGPGTLVGTPAYMAPEQLRGEDLDGRADQFSWGVMAFELLTGRLPFGHGRDVIGVIACVLGDMPPPLEGVPEVVAIVIERALAKRQEERFSSMDEIVELLEPFVTGDVAPRSRRASSPMIDVDTLDAPAPTPVTELPAPQTPAASGPSGLERRPQRRKARWALLVGSVVVVGAAAIVSSRWTGEPAPAPAPPAATAPPAPVPTPVTELPAPQTRSPEALATYREGLQAFRDAQWVVAHQAFQRAVELDPFFAAAHLRLAQTSRHYGTVQDMRARFRRAVSLRSALNERDQMLLEALEPILLRDPADSAEAKRRAERVSQRFPGDAELIWLTALLSTDAEEKLRLAHRCDELDPRYADCWQMQAVVLLSLGREEESREALDRCVEASPAATDCVYTRAQQHEHAGRCEQLAEDARRSIAHTPDVFSLHFSLATALYSLGQPLGAVDETLKRGLDQARAEAREYLLPDAEARVSILRGELRQTERRAREAAGRRKERIPVRERDDIELLLVELQQEQGRDRDAARFAAELLSRLEALPSRASSDSVSSDVTMLLLAAKLYGGAIDRDSYRAARSAWLRSWEDRIPAKARGTLWVLAYAETARAEEDAREALDVLPRFQPLNTSTSVLLDRSAIGKVHLLAGHAAEALPHLEAAARTCSALRMPVRHTVAHHHLGLAREALGDTAGACAAYRVVLSRWPASSGSVTARAAAARVKALRCPER